MRIGKGIVMGIVLGLLFSVYLGSIFISANSAINNIPNAKRIDGDVYVPLYNFGVAFEVMKPCECKNVVTVDNRTFTGLAQKVGHAYISLEGTKPVAEVVYNETEYKYYYSNAYPVAPDGVRVIDSKPYVMFYDISNVFAAILVGIVFGASVIIGGMVDSRRS